MMHDTIFSGLDARHNKGLLPIKKKAGCARTGNAENVFPANAG